MNITVYCGASKGTNPVLEETAELLGTWIAKQKHTLVYGGGKSGLMGVIADTVLNQGGKVIGIIPEFLKDREIAHEHLSHLYVVESMIERKKKLFELADVFIALPGGPGTLEEISEMVSWSRIGQNNHPCIFFNPVRFYDLLMTFYDSMVENGFLTTEDRNKILFSNSIKEVEEFIKTYHAPSTRRYDKNESCPMYESANGTRKG